MITGTHAARSSAMIEVIGDPAPQGSKSFKGFRGGKAILAESSKNVKPWRESVIWAAREQGISTITGPVSICIVFTVRKPKSAPKTKTTYPDRKPDLDKLERSTWDALVQAGVIEDDSRIVWNESGKVYPNEHADALDVPGARIWVHKIIA